MINKLLCGKIGGNLPIRPISFVALLILLLVCLLSDSLLSGWRPRCFCICVSLTVALLKSGGGWRILLVFLENITSCACLARSGLSDLFHWYAQSCIFNKSLLSTETEAFVQLTIENKEVLSLLVLAVNHWYTWEENKGSNTELCGISAFTSLQLEDWPLKTTLRRLLWRNDSMRLRRLPFTLLFFSLYRMP